MHRYIDAPSILAEAKMMQKDCQETYILIEGESDKIFFNTLMEPHPQIRFRPVNGWKQVYDTIRLAQEESYTNIAGIIDKDYHQLIEDTITETPQLFFTDANDIEMMLFLSSAFEKFLTVCADESKLNLQLDPRKPILTAASYLGALRAISLTEQYHFCFDGFECKDFVHRNTLVPNCKQLIEIITQRTRSKGTQVIVTNESLETCINAFIQAHSPLVLCNGHDVLDILSIAMTKLYASYSSNQYNADALFDYLLMGYTREEFQESELYKKLFGWIHTMLDVA